MFNNVTFAFPWAFYLFFLIPILVFLYIYRLKKKNSSIYFSSLKLINKIKPNWRERLRHLPFVMRILALSAMIIALARPQTFTTGENVSTEGIDIAIVLDISGSMLAEDFRPNRIVAAKNVIGDFIKGRISDRIGLVIFAGQSFTQCPLTIDYDVLLNLLNEIKNGMVEDGTAIGNAIANGVNRLKDSDAKSKVIILLTDGVNNAGEIDPITAAQIANTFGIRIYSIGVGTIGEAPYPFQTPFGIRHQMVPVEIDETTLKEISSITGGNYYRATGNKKLEQIYYEIDKLERSKIEVTSFRNASELFHDWLLLGMILLMIEFIFTKTIFRKIP